MGITTPCLNAIDHVINNTPLKAKKGALRVLSVGYPDVLISKKDLNNYFSIEPEDLKVHPESKRILSYHGKTKELEEIFTTESVLGAMGVKEFVSIDVEAHEGSEVLVDMNYPVLGQVKDIGEFDIVLDLGTMEHCFNVPQFMQNLEILCKPLDGGYIIHWNPFYSINHGFYNFNPTFYKDWYEERSAQLISLSVWGTSKEGQKCNVIVPLTDRVPHLDLVNSFNLVIVRNSPKLDEFKYPVQTKYKSFIKGEKENNGGNND